MSFPAEKKRVILICNRSKPETLMAGRDLAAWLGHHAHIVGDNLLSEINLELFPAADFCIVLGGDGSILATVRNLKGNQTPVIGVNMGKLGFLAEFSVAQIKEQWSQITSRNDLVSRRLMLHCEISGPGHGKVVSTAVNELAVIAGPPFRMIEVVVSVGGELLAVSAGDGLIVSTPTGSTAYNLSAGGPILAGTLQAAVITPLAAHSLSFRPIVVPLDVPIVIRCRKVRTGHPEADEGTKASSGVVVIDGQDHTPVCQDDEIVVTRSPHQFLLVRNPRQGQWQLLNNKLNWGALPNYESDGS